LPPLQNIDSQQVHFWHAFVAEQSVGDHAAGYLDLLTAQEREQHQRFYFDKDRDRYLITRVLVRTALSRYAPIEPRDWSFESNAYGRPRIANKHVLARRLRFNISHTDSLIVLAIAVDRDIGVDVESTARRAPLEVAERFFSQQEATALRRLPASAQAHRFWELWTFKESYIKARGMGLSLSLEKFSFHLDSGTDVQIAFEKSIDDSPSHWDFWQLKPDADHLVALCLARTLAGPVEFTCCKFTPSQAVTFASTITRCSTK